MRFMKIVLAAIALAFAVGIAGCDREEGPAEEAGESIDQAAEDVKDAAEEAGDEMEEAAEEMEDAAEDDG